MQKTIQTNLKAIVLGLILAGGIGYVGAAGTFTGPTCAPPGCNVDAPLNAGVSIQAKEGRLSIGSATLITGAEILQSLALKVTGTIQSSGALFTGPIAIADVSKGEGKVLVSDINGLANWRDPASLGIGGGSTTHGYIQLFGSGTWPVPAGVTSIEVHVMGGGGAGRYAGGMGGGYGTSILNVTPGQNFNYSVGNGGIAVTDGGTAGGQSSFDTIVAYGGLAGEGEGAKERYPVPLPATAGGFSGADLGAYGHSRLDEGFTRDSSDKPHGYASGFPLSRGGGGATNLRQNQVGVMPTYGGGGNGDSDIGDGYLGGNGATGAILIKY